MERILIVHNTYQHRGGEDSVVSAETELLRDNGHEVFHFTQSYSDIANYPKWRLPGVAVWSSRVLSALETKIFECKPDVVHFHNTFPLISYGAYWKVRKLGKPVVQTIHNFRPICPGALLYRNGSVCEDCVGKFPWRGVVHGCYRDSKLQTLASIIPLGIHRVLGTLNSQVTLFIALNRFGLEKYIEAGFPREKFRIKPNFLTGFPPPDEYKRAGGLYVGRLSHEKGLNILADAVSEMPEATVSVIGGGDLENFARQKFSSGFLGSKELPEILQRMSQASFLVIPSTWYEGFPRTIVEAFAAGLPVIASRLGAMAEIVQDHKTGLLFTPGDSKDLKNKIAWALANPGAMLEMGKTCRREYETRYSEGPNYQTLLGIYREAIALVS